MIRPLFVLLLCLFLIPATVAAQTADAIKGAAGAPIDGKKGSIGAGVGFGMIGDDVYTTLNLSFTMDLGEIGFGLMAPLRLCLYDANPEEKGKIGGVIRRQDWNEFTDYLKILRFFRYGHKGDFVHVMVGSLPGASLGHGTIANRYYNNLDLDHYKLGLVMDLNTAYGGVETLFNNAVLSNLLGMRGYFRPWSVVNKESYLNNLAVGASVVSDVTAPYRLDPSGAVENGYPKVDGTKGATIYGGDVEFTLLNNAIIRLIPYMDLNRIVEAGLGYHAGVLTTFHIPVVSLDLQTRLEYRRLTADYIPAYFNSNYEIQKFQYAMDVNRPVPKRAVVAQSGDAGINGYFAEVGFDFMGLVSFGGSYDDYDGPNNSNLRLYLDVPALKVFQFSCFYYKGGFDGAAQAFKFDDKSMFLVEARYQINPILYVSGQYWRIWKLYEGSDPDKAGTYQAVNDWSAGFGMSYNF